MKKLMKRILKITLFLVLLIGMVYYWFPGLILESARDVFRFWAGLERVEVQVNEHRWVYLKGGEGETILFVHGFGADKDRWGLFPKAFIGDYQLILPDLPGFGENSQIHSASYDIPTQVNRLNRFVETIGLHSFHLLGISMGGYIAASYASEYPEKVKSLALMDAAGVRSRIPSVALQLYEKGGKIILIYKTRGQFDELMSVLFHKPLWIPGRFKDYIAKIGATNYDFHKKILMDMYKDGGMYLLESRLPKVEAQTLIIWGANDRVTPVSSVEKFEKGLKSSHSVIIENCGHVPYIEKRAEAERAYKEFLESDKLLKEPKEKIAGNSEVYS